MRFRPMHLIRKAAGTEDPPKPPEPITDIQKANDTIATLEKSNREMKAEIDQLKKDAKARRRGENPEVVHKSPITGKEFLKSDHPDVVELAKENDDLVRAQRTAQVESIAKDMPYLFNGDVELAKSYVEAALDEDDWKDDVEDGALAEVRKQNDTLARNYKVHSVRLDKSAGGETWSELVQKAMAKDPSLDKAGAEAQIMETPEGTRAFNEEFPH